uniref:Acidic leucine-rich nuclear phosphoprotein 32 family member n=1 Tax=Spermophilus dauricus TaxID=99837 RepID=A0A8C9PD46_SPEDA
MELKKRMNMGLLNRALEEVTELVLDNCLCVNGKIKGLNDTFKELEFLCIDNVELSSLAQLPSLNKLQKLELKDNDDDDFKEGKEEEKEEEEGLQVEKRKQNTEDHGEEEDDYIILRADSLTFLGAQYRDHILVFSSMIIFRTEDYI